jgi:hypothetical protein
MFLIAITEMHTDATVKSVRRLHKSLLATPYAQLTLYERLHQQVTSAHPHQAGVAVELACVLRAAGAE